MFRRLIIGAVMAALAAAASAQQFPSKPVTLLCPWPPSGSTDIGMRALAEATGKYLGQPVVIENKPGAAGTLGAAAMLNARPDGYTVTQIPLTVFRLPHLEKIPFDPLADLT
jgi:tripartite-type tricarboxylate transporter receptor subunit TctC